MDTTPHRTTPVRRGFIDVVGGQIHYRYAGSSKAPPLVLIHASPGSSKSLEPLIHAFAPRRWVIAPDTMGNGDSAADEMPVQPEISYFAGRALEALQCLGIEKFDLYGTHTGGSIAAEIAIQVPGQVRHLVIDGIGLYPDDLQRELLERYAPAMKPDLHGNAHRLGLAFCARHLSFLAMVPHRRGASPPSRTPVAPSTTRQGVGCAQSLNDLSPFIPRCVPVRQTIPILFDQSSYAGRLRRRRYAGTMAR